MAVTATSTARALSLAEYKGRWFLIRPPDMDETEAVSLALETFADWMPAGVADDLCRMQDAVRPA